MSETLHGGRGNTERDRVAGAKQWDRGVYGGYVTEDSRTDTVFGVGLGVFEEGGARVGALVVVIAGLLVHAGGGMLLKFGDGQAIEVVGLLRCHHSGLWMRDRVGVASVEVLKMAIRWVRGIERW